MPHKCFKGKSLSIICGTLKWLEDYNEYERNRLPIEIELLEDEKIESNADTSDWIQAQSETIRIQSKINELKIQENEITTYDKKIEKLFHNKSKKQERKHSRVFEKNSATVTNDQISSNVEEEILDEDILIQDNTRLLLEESEKEESTKYRPVQVSENFMTSTVLVLFFFRFSSVVELTRNYPNWLVK